MDWRSARVNYFDRVADRLDEALADSQGKERSLLGQAVFTCLHFPIIAGIIVAAADLEVAMAHLEGHHLGEFGVWTLGGGVALFLTGTVATVVRVRVSSRTGPTVTPGLIWPHHLAMSWPWVFMAGPVVLGCGRVSNWWCRSR